MDATLNPVAYQANSSHLHNLIDRGEKIIQNYWIKNPDLFQRVQLEKQQETVNQLTPEVQPSPAETPESEPESVLTRPLRGSQLRAAIAQSYAEIRERTSELNAEIIPRTQAYNRKNAFQTIEEEQAFRAEVVEAQIQSWRSLLPNLIQKFSKIPDYRRTKSVKHKVTVLMAFGLFAFMFRLGSRREINRELTGPVIFDHLKKLFPEMDSIPHADTLARLLENTDPQRIEALHMSLIKELISKKKFKPLLIHDCLPLTIDGTQKLYREGLLQDPLWCERNVGHPEDNNKQQYIYTIEANITLKNGLSIPLMTEYLCRDNNELLQTEDKQDSETTAFERMAERLKDYFPRLKMIFFMDAMYATQTVMDILHQNNWEYIIRLPKKKLKDFAKCLDKAKAMSQSIPGQAGYRERRQEFHWQNNITYGYEWQLNIHLVACAERYERVDKKTGKIIQCFSEHAWISSILITIHNVHELLNLGARKKELIEDSMNTEKNRGYHYKHAFSYNWNAMQGFHYLMRLGHAINAICEFTKKLKNHIRELGCGATLKLIKETLFSPWLPTSWYEDQSKKAAQLRLQLE